MKKNLLFFLAVCFLFLAAGCGTGQPAREPEAAQTPVPEAETEPAPASETEAELLAASEEEAEPRTVGMVAVCGKPDTDIGQDRKIYTEWISGEGFCFPLDAAMFFNTVEGNRITGVGSQNVSGKNISVSTHTDHDLRTGRETTTESIMITGNARYNSTTKKEFTIYTYDVQYDGERAWFDPYLPNQVNTLNSGDGISITFSRAECELRLLGAAPTVSLMVTCLQGETELRTETLQAEEMDAYLKYPLPEGTDRVDVVYFDAGGGIIGEESLQKFGGSFDVWYDIGGFFLGHKTLSPEWK